MILKLIDVDEDDCLSVGEVFKMICYIERNFVCEMNQLRILNQKSLKETSLRNSIEKFKIIMNVRGFPLDKIDQRFLNQTLITFREFTQVFVDHPQFLKVYLPRNINMESFIVWLSNEGYSLRGRYARDRRRRLQGFRGICLKTASNTERRSTVPVVCDRRKAIQHSTKS